MTAEHALEIIDRMASDLEILKGYYARILEEEHVPDLTGCIYDMVIFGAGGPDVLVMQVISVVNCMWL